MAPSIHNKQETIAFMSALSCADTQLQVQVHEQPRIVFTVTVNTK